ncbi:hypothetical protein BOX15_Mlig005244g2 [Macrostomum lignano]|uniref:RRM domain-containing protein n=1 Tax=Macrostomum lignano TaxID=282301 RepID=A0A267FP37_9PLAT|nr:hypothetical protein BOX15_Mlig005244g2 [Macrostomum lignano]
MLYELVMVPPNMYNTAAVAAGSGGGAAASNAAAAAAAAGVTPNGLVSSPALAGYPGYPGGPAAAAAASLQTALTGVPLNKGLQVTLPSAALALSTQNHKLDTTSHYHIFVGDLAPEIESHQLKEAFSAFGIVTECKIIKDMHTQKPKGYGFVAYANREEAEEAMQKMNGQLLGSRTIRTNWAVRKPPQPPADQKPLNYDEVAQAASNSNCTVYVGGITRGLCEELLREAFKDFGEILEVRVFKEKGYAFVRFDTHEGATKAIITMHGKDVGGQPCKCSWGKESNDKENATALMTPYGYYAATAGATAASPLAYQAYNQLSYLQQPINYANYASAAAAAAAAASSAYQGGAASGGLLNGFGAAGGNPAAAAAAAAAQLAAASHAAAFGTPTSAAVSFQQAH